MVYFDDGNRYVVVILDVKNGHPETDEDMQPTSPIIIRKMCKELMDEHKAMDKADAIRAAGIMAKQNGMVLGDNYPPAFDTMGWGDWREVSQYRTEKQRKVKDNRLFIVKVIDTDITEIDRKYRAGMGGG